MADNYLEKQMEDYRSGKFQTRRPSARDSRLIGLLRGQTFLFVEADGYEELMGALTEAGCKVAFLSTDRKLGPQIAQTTGSQFHPCTKICINAIEKSISLIQSRWGHLDNLISSGHLPLVEALKQTYPGLRIIGIH